MSEATCLIDETSYSGGFYRAILAIYKGEYAEAQRWVDCARTALQPELRAVVGDSYARAHAPLVLAQQLAETEELIAYKQCEAVLRGGGGGGALGGAAGGSDGMEHARERCARCKRLRALWDGGWRAGSQWVFGALSSECRIRGVLHLRRC
eukprot:1304493-Pleurochrysis_carterae.AAC.1